jgi:hypothetical protein
VIDFELTHEIVEAMKESKTSKFMVTKDSDGKPNVVPVMSWTVYIDNT